MSLSAALLSVSGAVAAAGLTADSLTTYVDSITLPSTYNPIKEAYWTNYIHHRRIPFAESSSGKACYIAYLDSSNTGVYVQAIDCTTFTATGTAVSVAAGKEAGGLVAHDDGFALLTNEALPSGTANGPTDGASVPVLYRFDASGTQLWKTWLGGPSIDDDMGHLAAPDMNGDLVYSNATGRYATYTVMTAYDGNAAGHYGDAIRYIDDATGKIVSIPGASSSFGCSHNTGIALEAADEAPYASVCCEDQGAIWLNSKGQGMTTVGTKISNENTTNGAGGEATGAMSGSYSALARWQSATGYIFAWVSRGAVDLTANTWMGDGYTAASNRTNGRNVAIATFTDKYTMVQEQASSVVGAADGDSQVNWITTSTTADQSNAHVATFDSTTALVTWEEIADPFCEYIAFGCRGSFTGAYYQLVSSDGTKIGEPLVTKDVTVSGDLVTMTDGRICWPYVSGTWDLLDVVGMGAASSTVSKLSIACMSAGGSSSTTGSTSGSAAVSSHAAASSSTVATSSVPEVAVAAAAPTTPAALSSAPAAVVSVVPTDVAAAEPVVSAAPVSSSATTMLTSVVPATPLVSGTPRKGCGGVKTVYVNDL